jgi:hypothetical protein
VPNYKAVAAGIERDRDLILEIWRRNLHDVYRLAEKFDWHFRNNPCGSGQCWILEADGRPAGTTSLGLREIKLGNQVIAAGIACDLAVDEAHRFLLPALTLQKALLASMHDFVRVAYGLPNPRGAAVMKRAGYREVMPVHRYAKALRVSPYLLRNPRLAWSAPILGSLADFAYAGFLRLRERSNRSYSAAVFADFDARFDELWMRVKSAHSCLTVRDSRFLRWRYRDCPLHQYTTLGLLSADRSRLLGYVIYYAEDGCAVCADIFSGSDDRDVDCLLSAWVCHARQSGLTGMSAVCNLTDAVTRGLHRTGFTRRTVTSVQAKASPSHKQESSHTLLAHSRQSADDGALAAWYFTYGDQPY